MHLSRVPVCAAMPAPEEPQWHSSNGQLQEHILRACYAQCAGRWQQCHRAHPPAQPAAGARGERRHFERQPQLCGHRGNHSQQVSICSWPPSTSFGSAAAAACPTACSDPCTLGHLLCASPPCHSANKINLHAVTTNPTVFAGLPGVYGIVPTSSELTTALFQSYKISTIHKVLLRGTPGTPI